MPKTPTDIRSLARSYTDLALKTLKGIAGSPKAPAAARVSAASAILDRGWGKPMQAVEHSGPDGSPIKTEELSGTELARKLAFILTQGVKKNED